MGIDPEVRESLQVLELPAQDLSTESMDEYNMKCTNFIQFVLEAMPPGSMIRTHYPGETSESEDTVKLGENGEVVVVDWGTS